MSARSTSSSSNEGVRDDVREDSQLDLQLLSPKEAFEKFDSDSSGDIDQEEFYALLEAVGINGNHEYQEKLFRRFANKKQNAIRYEDFRRAWLLLANTKDELLDRVGGLTRQQLFSSNLLKSFNFLSSSTFQHRTGDQAANPLDEVPARPSSREDYR